MSFPRDEVEEMKQKTVEERWLARLERDREDATEAAIDALKAAQQELNWLGEQLEAAMKGEVFYKPNGIYGIDGHKVFKAFDAIQQVALFKRHQEKAR